MNGVVSPVFLATTLSTIASIAACAYFIGFLRARRAQSGIIERSTTIAIALVTLPIAWFLGYVVGGNFGGSIASQLSFLSEAVVIPIGIAIGIFVVTSFLSCTLTLIGLGVGILLQRVFGRRPSVKD
jgi:predicted small integral membrane protein